MKKFFRRISVCLLILFSIQIFTNIKINAFAPVKGNADTIQDIEKPTSPRNLKSIFMVGDRATLIWDKSSDDVGVTGYDIFIGDKQIASSSKTSYEITGLQQNTEYIFKVRAKDASGKVSEFSNSIKIVTSEKQTKNNEIFEETTPQANFDQYETSDPNRLLDSNSLLSSNKILDPNKILDFNEVSDSNETKSTIPNEPDNLESSNQTETSITLNWKCKSGDYNIVKYNIYNGTTKIGTTNGETDFVISNLIPGTSYNLSVTAVDSMGNVSLSSEVLTVKTKEDKEPPTKATNLKIESKNEISANIIWSEGSDNIGVSGYDIYNGDLKIGTVEASSSYFITGLSPNTTYYYTVKTRDLAGNLSENSDVVEVTTDKDTDAPSIPTDLKIVSNNDKEVTINWNESKDISKVSYYEIYSDGQKIGTTADGTSFTAKELTNDKVYNFTVRAVDDSGNASIDSATLVYKNTANSLGKTTKELQKSENTNSYKKSMQSVSAIPPTYTWNNVTVGNAWPVGSYSCTNGTHKIQSRGWNIGGDNDACQYVYAPMNGDYSITTRVTSIDNPNSQYGADIAAKAGLMIRNTTDTSSSNVFIGITSSNKILLTYRNGYKQYTYEEGNITGTAPVYLKLTRLGKTITGFESSDGITWTQVGETRTIDDLQDNILMGMTVTANCNEKNLATGTFDNTSIECSDKLAPSIPTITGGSLNSDGSISLSWTKAIDNVLVSGYKVYRNGEEIADVKNNLLTYTDSSVNGNNNVYTYTVKAYDRSGNMSEDSNKQICGIDTSIPSAPTDVKASSIDGGNITLKWTTPQNSGSIVAYDVFSADDKLIGTTTVDSITISDLTANTSYSYYVKARNISNIYSKASNSVVATTTSDDYGNSAAKASEIKIEDKVQGSFEYTGDKDFFKLTPSKSAEYTIKSYGNANINISLVDSNGNSVTAGSLCDSEIKVNLLKNQIYYLKVYSYYSYGNYEFSINEVINEGVKTPELKLENKTPSTVDLSWNYSNNVDHYDLYRNSKKIATISGDLASFKDTMLNGNTQYEYRIIAFDKLGKITSPSNEVVVTTETNNKVPSVPTSIKLLSKTSESMTISWNIPDGNGEDVYYLIYNGEVQVGESHTNTFTLNNLSANSVQNIRIMAKNSTGLTSQISEKISETTYNDDYGNKIQNATEVIAGKNYTGELEYTGDSDIFKFIPTVSSVYYFNSGIRPVLYDVLGNKLTENKYVNLNKGTTYYFEVKSETLNKYSFVIKLSRPSTVEVAPYLYESKISGSTITINWNKYQDTLGIDKYYIYRNGIQIAVVSSDILNYTDGNLNANSAYSYYVVGKDVMGTMLKKSNLINVTTSLEKIVPTTPSDITITSGITSVIIKWTQSTDASGIKGYEIYRDGVFIEQVTSNSFEDKHVIPGTSYIYKIRAIDALNNLSEFSTENTIKTVADVLAPSIPTDLDKINITSGSATLTWKEPLDNGKIVSYVIYKDGSYIGESTTNSFNIKGLNINTEYKFSVAAKDSAGNLSSLSDECIVKTLNDDYGDDFAFATEISIGKNISRVNNYTNDYDFFKFKVNTSGKYKIESSYGYSSYYSTVYDENGNALTMDSDCFELKEGKTYYLSVTGYVTNFKIMPVIKTELPPTIPTGLKVTNIDVTKITLNWNASTDLVAVDYYEIYRDGKSIGKVDSSILTYTDSKLAPSTSYNYVIKAYNVYGISSGVMESVKATTAEDIELPTSPTDVSLKNITGFEALVNWSASTDNGEIQAYEVFINGNYIDKTTNLNYLITGLQPSKEYTVTIRAKDTGNNYSAFESIKINTIADDYGDNCNSASTISVGRVISGKITYSDIDFFKFIAPISGKYSLKHIDDKMFSLIVYDEDGKKILYNEWNDSNGSSFDLIQGKTYYLSTNSYGNYSFRINVAETESPSKVIVSNNSEKTTIVTTTISWTVASDNVGIDYYEIYRDGTKIAKVNYDISTFVDKGLKAYTNHTYYVKAIDVSGNSSQSDSIDVRTLWDSEDPLAPTNLKVVAKTAWTVTLSWDASTDDGAIESYEIYDGSEKVGETEGLSFTITGLNQNTAYNFKVIAKDTAGKYSKFSDIMYITTYADDYKNTINEASEIRIGKVLNGTMNYYNDLDYFTFIAPISGDYTFESLGLTSLYATLYNWNNNPYDETYIGYKYNNRPMVLTLEAGKKYTLQVNAYGTGGYALKVSISETEKPYQVPSNLQNVSTTASTSTISWTAAKDNVGIDYYEIYRNKIKVGRVDDSVLSYTDSKLISSTEYSYTVKAIDMCGNISDESLAVTIKTAKDLVKPLSPAIFTVNSRTSSSILLSWTEAVDNDGVIQKYEIYNGIQKLGESYTTSFEVENLNYNTNYTFTIKAIDSGNNVSDGKDINITTYGDDYGNDINHAKEIELVSEIKGKLDYDNDVDYFTFEGKVDGIYTIKSLGSLGVNAEILSTLGNVLASSDISNSDISIVLSKGDKYYIKISKTNNIINYGFIIQCQDNEKPTTPSNLSLQENTIAAIKISWCASTDNVRVKEYKIYRDNYEIATVSGNVLAYLDTMYVGGQSHGYYIRAVDPNNNYSVESEKLTVVALKDNEGPSKPTGLSVTNRDNHSISLKWLKSTDNKATTSYKVYVNGIYNNDITTTESVTITGLAPNTEYSFTVKAFDADGNESEMSDELKVITPWILESNELVQGDLIIKNGSSVNLNGYQLKVTGNLEYNGGALLIRTGQLVVDGNMTINDSDIDLETGSIQIGGSLYQKGGNLNINRGKLLIKGNFIISNGTQSSVLIMNQEDAYVLVEGNFETSSNKNHLGRLTNGVIEIKGDFTRIQGVRCNFACIDNHIVVLSGSSVQRVTYPVVDGFTMNILVLSKPYDTGYVFSTMPCWKSAVDKYAINNTFGVSDGQGVYGPTGNYCKQFTDLKVNNNGKDFVLVRTYNSLDTKEDKGFGKGWTFNYEASVTDLGGDTNTVIAKLPDGSSQSFKKNNDGSYTSLNSRNILKKNSSGLYVLTTKDQTNYEFNINGYLVKVTDKYGNIITINVNDKGKVIEIVDAALRKYTITYDSTNSLISSITDPNGGVTTYSYNGNKLVKVIDPLNNSTTYEYNDNGLLKTIKDSNNHESQQITYYTNKGINENKVNIIVDEYGNKQTYDYNMSTMVTTITDSNGRTTKQAFNSTFNLISATDAECKITTTTYFMDGDNKSKFGEIQSTKDRNGNTTSYERDSRGNITKITNPDRSFKLMEYDEMNNLIKETNVDGKYTYYIYDPTKVYLINKVQPLNGTDVYSTSAVQSKFAITTYEYYPSGTVGESNLKGLLKSVTDPNGNKTTYSYDKYGNVNSVTDGENNTTKSEYNINGWKTKVTTPGNNIAVYNYDKKGNVIRIITNGLEVTRKVYDSLGRLIKEILPNQYKASDDISDSIYNGDYGKRYTYYDNGKLKTVTDAEGYTISYTYDLYGNVLTETKPNGAIYRNEYDFMNRLVRTYFKANSSAKEILLESHKYEILNNGNTQKTDSKYFDGNNTKYSEIVTQYDYAGRAINAKNSDGLAVVTVYNANGTISSSTDTSGNTTYYEYDGLNRISEQWTPIERIDNIIYYTYNKVEYDNVGNKIKEIYSREKVLKGIRPVSVITKTYVYYKNNKVKSESLSSGSQKQYEYDNDGNLTKEITKIDDTSYSIKEYVYNKLGKVQTESYKVLAGDLSKNNYTDTGYVEILTQNEYDKEGNLTKTIAADNSTTQFTYDNLGRVVKCEKSNNGVILTSSKTYNWEGKVLTETDGNGNIKSYTYDERGLLIKVTDANGNTTLSSYDIAGRKIAEVAPNDYSATKQLSEMNRTEYVYDNMSRVIEKKVIYFDLATNTWKTISVQKFEYDNSSNVLKETAADGSYVTKSYNLANKVETICDGESNKRGLKYSVKYSYDGNGNLISETNANETSKIYTYDEAGNVISTSVKGKDETIGTVLGSSTYNYVKEALTSTDGNGVITTYEYNEFGKIRKITYAGDSSIEAYYIVHQYDALGRLTKKTDSRGVIDAYTYDSFNRELTHTQSKADGTEAITTSATYDNNGNKTSTTDGNGNVTEYKYNEANKLTSKIINVTDSNNIKVKQETKYTYDNNGNLLTETNWLGNTITNVYDSLNRVIEKKDQNNITIQKLEYNDNGTQSKSTDALGNITTFEYDNNKRLIKTTDPTGAITQKTYDAVGNIASATDGNLNIVKYYYDKTNKLIKVETNNNGILESTSYTYDINGNMLTQKDGAGNVTTFVYNVANKVSKKIYSEGTSKEESYTYYGNGLEKESVDRNGIKTTSVYDIHERLISQKTGDIEITYTYDKNGNALTITDSAGTTTRTYDELNSVTSKTVPVIGKSTYFYDVITGITGLAPGNYGEITIDPKGNKVIKIYDKTKRLVEVRDGNNKTTYTYYNNGSLKEVTLPNNFKESYEYYSDNKLKTLFNKDASGNVIEQYTYTYDKAKNLLSKVDPKGTTTYTYDSMNRLWTVTEPGQRKTTYTYDGAGNRDREVIVKDGITTINQSTYDGSNRLLKIKEEIAGVLAQDTDYTYDNNGNQLTSTITNYQGTITKSTTSYRYDALNQMIGTTKSAGLEITYGYNGEGLRVLKTSNGKTVRYLYEGDKVILEVDGNGVEKARSVNGINQISRTIAGEVLYYLYNGHGDVTKLTNALGNTVATYYYDAFGEIIDSSGSADNPIRYAGYQYDEETGLYYLNARMYDPTIARFLQEDTCTGNQNDPLSLNLYAYCNNNPLVYSDPTGHWPKLLDNAVNAVSNVAEDVINWASDAWEGAKNTVSDTWAGMKSAASAMYGSIKKGDPNVIGEGVKAAASGYAESKANREAKKKSENSGKGITIANYGVANLGDVNNKLNNANNKLNNVNKGLSKNIEISKAGGFGTLAMVGTTGIVATEGFETGTIWGGISATLGGTAATVGESIGGIAIGSVAFPLAVGATAVTAMTLLSKPVIVGQSEADKEAAINEQKEKKEKEEAIKGGSNASDVELKYKDGWTDEQKAEADEKVKALSEADTIKTAPNRKGTSASSRYKKANGPDSVPSGNDVDHTIDLQLGGADDILNMNPLDASVNRSLGKQIQNKIKNYPNGTRFGEFKIK